MSPQRNTPESRPDGAGLRPLSARSLIASLLLRSQPPRMRGSRLVQWCGLFGVSEGTARVALSRMVERGELRATDGTYEPAGRVHGRRVGQDWSLTPRLRSWKGAWRFAVVDGGARSADERAALRDAMRHLRFGLLRDGLWTRPDNLPRGSAPEDWWAIADAQCTWWSARPDDDPGALAVELFGGGVWEARARALTERLTAATRALGVDDALADAFLVGAGALAHLRADPLLPAALVTDATAGDALRRSYRAYEAAFSRAIRMWFRDQVS